MIKETKAFKLEPSQEDIPYSTIYDIYITVCDI